METRKEEGREFHRAGPMVTNDLVCAKVVLVCGTKRSCRSKEQERLERSCRMRKANDRIMLSVQVFLFGGPKTIKINRHQENHSSTCSSGEPKVKHCRSMDPELQSCTEHDDVHYNSLEYTSLESKTLKNIIYARNFFTSLVVPVRPKVNHNRSSDLELQSHAMVIRWSYQVVYNSLGFP